MEPELAPPAAIAAQVEALWTFTTGAAPVVHRVPPDGCLDLIVELDPATGAITARVYGPTSRFDDVALAPGRRLAGLRFRAGLGALVLDARGDELADGGCPLAAIAPAAAAIIGGAARADDLPARLAAAAAALCARARPTAEHRRVARAIAAFAAGDDRIAAVAADLAVAERTLHRDFLLAVGLAPRRYLRIARARRAAAALAAGHAIAAVAADCGYADQAHLTRELVALHGVTPAHVRNLQDRRPRAR